MSETRRFGFSSFGFPIGARLRVADFDIWISDFPLRQFVAHLVALRGDVTGVVLVDRADDRHLIDDLQVETAVDEGVGLLGVVRQQADPRDARGP